jgi:hypothetical protein
MGGLQGVGHLRDKFQPVCQRNIGWPTLFGAPGDQILALGVIHDEVIRLLPFLGFPRKLECLGAP